MSFKLSVLAALLATSPSIAAWMQEPEWRHLQGGDENGVWMIDGSNGVVVGDGGRIRFSSDGGATWEMAKVPSEVRGDLRGVFFLNNVDGWAVGDNGAVLRTSNSGVEWDWVNEASGPVLNLNTPPEPAELYDIQMFDDEIGYVVGNKGVLQVTSNGGVSWSTPPATGSATGGQSLDFYDLYDLHFTDLDNGFVAADWGSLWRVENGDWSVVELAFDNQVIFLCPVPDSSYVEFWGLGFANANEGWVCGGAGHNRGYIFSTQDGGSTWTQSSRYQPVDPVEASQKLCGISTLYAMTPLGSSGKALTVGYAASALVHNPGGGTGLEFDPCVSCDLFAANGEPRWEQSAHPPGQFGRPPLTDAFGLNATDVWITGTFGTIRRSLDSGTTWQEQGSVGGLRIGGADFADATTGCVIGTGHVIRRSTDAGRTWTTVYQPDPFDGAQFGNGLALSSSGAGVAIGTSHFVAVTSDAGGTWATTSVPGEPTLHAAAVAPGTSVLYVVGRNGYVARSDNGGATWSDVSIEQGPDLWGVDFADAQTGYVVGSGQTAFHKTTAGASWSAVPVEGRVGGEHFFAVDTYGDGSEAVVAGSGGLVYRKTGVKLVPEDLGAAAVDANLFAVQALVPSDEIMVSGQVGTVLHFDGSTWTSPKSHTSYDIFSLAFDAPDHGFAFAQRFGVIEYD